MCITGTDTYSKDRMSSMKAAVIRKYGGPEVVHLETIAKPSPTNKQVLVRVHSTSVTTGDWRVIGPNAPAGMSFLFRLAFGITAPRKKVLGQEFAGVVEEVGAAVTEFKVGDQVFGTNDVNFGAHSEFLCIDTDYAIIHKPTNSNMKMSYFGALAFGGVTSLYFVRDMAKLKKGDKILINGASGCLGTFAIQLAKYYGAHVTAVCSGKNAALVKGLGADKVIDYKEENCTDGSEKYDIIYDTVGNLKFSDSKKVLTENGQLLTAVFEGFGDLRKIMWNSMFGGKKKYRTGTPPIGKGTKKDLEFLAQLVEEGKLKVVIDSEFPLEKISDAFRLVDSGHKRGNAVVVVK
mmetsp:Transcript_15086/g.18654  ORF Transcript_15086/g.18654 Transcript_15086/m.18654 type:complete len:348 (-) Transcript_15086:726-1769(-)